MMATGGSTMANMTTMVTGGMTMADTTTTVTAGTATLHDVSDGSSGDNVASAIPNSIVAQARGSMAFLEERASILSQLADEAAAFAREAAADAQDFNNAHASIVAKHHKMFLQCAFDINLDRTVITDVSTLPEKLKKYKSVKTVKQNVDMIHVITTNWGDEAVLKKASSDDQQAATIRKFCKSNTQGYN